jgi:outer membrane protein OmpA-like peptidoglycan-associated protein
MAKTAPLPHRWILFTATLATLLLPGSLAMAQSTTGLGLEATLPPSTFLDQEGPDYILSETLIADMISFRKNQVRVSRHQKTILKRLARLVQERAPVNLEIHGFADLAEPNPQQVGQRRAQQVRTLLVRYGVPSDSIQIKNHSDEEAEPGFDLNRRVEFKLYTRIAFQEEVSFAPKGDTPASAAQLDQIAQRLQKHNFVRLRVLGHVDSHEASTRDARDKLALDRAAAIRRALIARGIPAERLSIVSLGDRASRRATGPHNRRVSFRMLSP